MPAVAIAEAGILLGLLRLQMNKERRKIRGGGCSKRYTFLKVVSSDIIYVYMLPLALCSVRMMSMHSFTLIIIIIVIICLFFMYFAIFIGELNAE